MRLVQLLCLWSCVVVGGSCNSSTTAPAPGATYYVSTNGNDDGPGTEQQPWRTIQKAEGTLVSGETVLIESGTYSEQLVPANSGNGQFITYSSYPGQSVTLDGAAVSLPSTTAGVVEISGKSYIRIVGLRIINAGPNQTSAGIVVDQSSNIQILSDTTYNTVSSGIGIWNSQDVIVRGNDVQLCVNDGIAECITVANTTRFEVSHNHVHNGGPGSNGGEGIDTKMGASNGTVFANVIHDLPRVGIYADAWDRHTYNISIYGNLIYSCEHGLAVASEQGGLLENVQAYNNVIFNNRTLGVAIGWPSVYGPTNNISIINNTIYQNGQGTYGGGIDLINQSAVNIIIRNNIVASNLSFQMALDATTATSTVFDHNLINGFRGYSTEVLGSNAVQSDPLFVNPAVPDLHLQAGSPAIDRGSPTGAPSVDFDGNHRPFGAGYDIGAYERQ